VNEAAATVTIDVVDQPPVTFPSTYTVLHDHQLVADQLSGFRGVVLANDFDPDGDPLTATVAPGGAPFDGTLTLNPDGSFTYTPSAHFAGTDTFTYLASDGVEQTSAIVTINVTNQAPVTNPDTFSVLHDHQLTVGAGHGFIFGVLFNDSDPDGDPLTVLPFPVDFDPHHGVLNLAADGGFTYTPDAGFVGTDTFTYLATDGVTRTPGTLTINVTDQAPVTAPDSYTVVHDHALASDLLFNDRDPDGDPLTVFLPQLIGPTHGFLKLFADGSFTYTPFQGYVGTDTFTYFASDGALTTPGTVTINVTNQAPVTAPDSYTVVHSHELDAGRPGSSSHGVLFNDFDPDGDPLTAIVAITGPQHGTLQLFADGSFIYRPSAGFPFFVGTDTFTYLAYDGATTTSGKVTINVTDQAPVAVNDSAAVIPGKAVTIDVLANDTDADGDLLIPRVKTSPLFGTLSLQPSGSFVYTPNAGFSGVDSFTYVANDGFLDSNVATVTLDVNASKGGAIVKSLVASPAAGDLGPGTRINFTVTMSEAVRIGGATPYLVLNNGGRADYLHGSNSNVLTFTYTVGPLGSGQDIPALAVTGFNVNGAVIVDANNTRVPDFAGVTAFTAGPQIDTRAPAVTERLANDTGVSGTDRDTTDDTLAGTGDPFATVTFTEGGNPIGTATANAGGSWTFAPIALAAGPHTIVASETDGAGNQGTASLTFILDSTPPVVNRFTVSLRPGHEATPGIPETLTYRINEAVTVSGTPILLLNDGGAAIYDAAQSTSTSLAFEYAVAPNQVTPHLAVSGILLSSTSAIADVAGNVMNTAQLSEESTLGVNTRPGGGPVGQTGGSFTIRGTQELELFGPPGSDSSAANVAFAAGSTGTLRLDNSAAFAGTVAGLALGNYLDLADLPFQGNTTPGYVPNSSNTGGTLSVTEGANSVNIALLGSYLAGSFVASSDGHGGTLVIDPPVGQQSLAAPLHA
jgi:VCBS repeat-containing protein